MMIPAWLLDIFAVIMLLVAAVSAARLVTARRWHSAAADAGPDVDVAHLLMGIAMAGMLTASLATLPDTAWEAVFGILTAWFTWRVYQEISTGGARILTASCHAPHLVHSAAMLYMFLALAGPAGDGSDPGGMGGMGGSAGSATPALEWPALALIFAFILVGYAVRDLDWLPGPANRSSYWIAGAGVITQASAMLATAPSLTRPTATRGLAASANGPATSASPGPADETEQMGTSGGATPRRPGGRVSTAEVETGCRIAMGITMALMLVIMI